MTVTFGAGISFLAAFPEKKLRHSSKHLFTPLVESLDTNADVGLDKMVHYNPPITEDVPAAATDERKSRSWQLRSLAEENSSLRHQLDDLAVKASEWASRAQDAEARLLLLNEQQSPASS